MSLMRVDRRSFLQVALGAAGALVIGVRSVQAQQYPDDFPPELLGDDITDLGPFLRIERDGRVVIGASGCEVGQGVMTDFPMLIAEELEIGWDQVRVIQLPYGYVDGGSGPSNRYGDQGGDSELAISLLRDDLRRAGALARWLLVQAAANEWALDRSGLIVENGRVVAPDGRRLSYGALARSAAGVPAPTSAIELKTPAQWRLIGTPTRMADGEELVRGRSRFGSDFYRAELVHAVILRCPFPDGTLESLDDSAARKIDGVVEIIPISAPPADRPLIGPLRNGVAVVATSSWIALKARAALKPVWKAAGWASESTAGLSNTAHGLLSTFADAADVIELRRDGDVNAARKAAARLIEARYELPYLAHATAEPPGALLDLRKDGALLIASLEDPDAASKRIADATGLPRRAIDIRLPRSGGSYGRRLKHDYIAEAIQIALVVKRPVKLFWTRSDDLRNDWYRPFGIHHMVASLDRKKAITSWVHHCAATPRGWRDPAWTDRPLWAGVLSADSFPAGLVANFERSFVPLESGQPRGDHRGREHTFTAFAEQCFIDEIAVATDQDAVQLRLDLMGESRELSYRGAPRFDTGRMAQVLNRCAEQIGWGVRRKDGHGIGIACHYVNGAYVAHGFDVAIERGDLVIYRVVCVADVGRVLNPLNVDGLLAGATTDALAAALNAAITVRDGQVQQKDFASYNVNPGLQTPRELVVERIDSSEPPVAVYSAATPSTAPALANAIFAASTVRIRKMPMLPELKRLL